MVGNLETVQYMFSPMVILFWYETENSSRMACGKVRGTLAGQPDEEAHLAGASHRLIRQRPGPDQAGACTNQSIALNRVGRRESAANPVVLYSAPLGALLASKKRRRRLQTLDHSA